MTDREYLIEDIAETALFGGIGYWAKASQVSEYGDRDRCRIEEFDERTGKPYGDGWNLKIAITDGLAKARDPEVQLNPQLRKEIVSCDIANDGGSVDTELADVIVQLGCFGEVKYG